MSSDGIIIVYLKEWYQNSIAEAKAEEDAATPVPEEPGENDPQIVGLTACYPYDKLTYTIENAENGT